MDDKKCCYNKECELRKWNSFSYPQWVLHFINTPRKSHTLGILYISLQLTSTYEVASLIFHGIRTRTSCTSIFEYNWDVCTNTLQQKHIYELIALVPSKNSSLIYSSSHFAHYYTYFLCLSTLPFSKEIG